MKTLDKEIFKMLSHTDLRTDHPYATSNVDFLKFRPRQTELFRQAFCNSSCDNQHFI